MSLVITLHYITLKSPKERRREGRGWDGGPLSLSESRIYFTLLYLHYLYAEYSCISASIYPARAFGSASNFDSKAAARYVGKVRSRYFLAWCLLRRK